MMSMLVGTGMNIILDPIFIFLFHLGIKEAAITMVISQEFSFSGADIGAVTVALIWLLKELKLLGIFHLQHRTLLVSAAPNLVKEEI